jgi:riboflavin transporter FmnP
MVLRKIRPRYKKALIPALIICFIIAVILLLILNKYFFRPIFEKRGSVPSNRSMGVMCLVEDEVSKN